MKNFRKVLALILVVATLFSFVAMASAKTADEYSDYADVKYVEAVDVLTAIGITEGYDGAYHPADTIDRDEVAAMVARLRNGGDIDADLYVGADNVFADVKGQWSEGYVTYCAQLGIIAGRNASTFDPDGKVTGTEVLKMLLCVLGYDAAEQGYVGANWQVNVVRDAAKAGLLIADVDPYKAATRDEVAQYFLNALESRMVIGYVGEGIINVTNSWFVTFENGEEGIFNVNGSHIITPDADFNGYEVAYCNAVISNTKLYQSISGLTTGRSYDCYKRPATTWAFGDWSGIYADVPSAVYTATTATALTAEKLNTLPVYVDGADDSVAFSAVDFGNGVKVEVFADRLVVINTYIAKVTKVSEYYDYFEVSNEDAKLARFTLGDAELAVNDFVLLHVCDGSCVENYQQYKAPDAWRVEALHDVAVVKPVEVEVDYGRGTGTLSTSYIIAGDKTYYYAENMGLVYAPVDYVNAEDVEDDATLNLYLDEYGYIMYWAHPTTETEYFYAYVEETGMTKKDAGISVGADGAQTQKYDYAANLVNFGEDGALAVEKAVAINDDLYVSMISRLYWDDEDITGNDVGQLIRYQKTATGAFDYNPEYAEGEYYYDRDGVEGYIGEEGVDYGFYAPIGARLNKTSFIIDDEAGIYADANTKFMIRTLGLDGKFTYEQVTGYKNLKETYVARAVNGEYTNIQYFVNAKSPDFATYVFIDARYTTGADHFLVVSPIEYRAFTTSVLNIYGEDYVAYKAIVDGVESVVMISEDLRGIRAGFMYENTLIYRGITLVYDENMPLYVWADDATPIMNDPVMVNVHNDGTNDFYNVWIEGSFARRVAAEDLVVYTVMGEQDAKGNWSISIVPELVDVRDDEVHTWEDIGHGYVYFNDDDQITEIYRIADTFYAAYFAD